MKTIIVCCALIVSCLMPCHAKVLGNILDGDYYQYAAIDINTARPLLIVAGIACMVIGNQDRNTDSGKILQLSGLVLTVTWTF